MACPCKQETLDFIYNKFLPYLNSGDPKMGDEIFSEDYKTVVSGTDAEFISPVGLRSDITGILTMPIRSMLTKCRTEGILQCHE